MHCIQNSCIGIPFPFNRAIAGFTCVLAITVIALSIIGLTASASGPFNAIVQFGTTTNGILLGTSIFVLILDLVWIAALYKKTKEQSVSRSGPSQLEPSRLGLPNPESLEQEPPQSALVQASEEINDTDSFSQQPEEINDTDSFSQQPEEIILRTFGFLSANELAKCGEISRRWRRLASDLVLWNAFDLRKISPFLSVIDKSDWERHIDLSRFGLNLDNVPLLDKRKVIPALKRIVSSLPRIEGNAGVKLLLIPEGLKIRTFVEMAELPDAPKNAPKIRYIWNRILDEIGDIRIDKTYWIVITNNIFEGSRDQSVSSQKALLQKMGWEMTKATEILALIALTYMTSEGQTRLYNNTDPWTCSRTSDQVGKRHVVVGCFSPAGVSVDTYSFDFDIIGVGGVLRKF